MIRMKIDTKTKKVLFGGEAKKMCKNACKSALNEIGELVTKETIQGIDNPPKTGRLYGLHRASKKGEYPANRTGKLINSIKYKIKNSKKMIVSVKTSYAEFLEEGTRKMAKRKLLGFTIKDNKNKIKDILRKNVNSEFK